MTRFGEQAGVRIIGVDVATQPKSVGLALCSLDEQGLRLEEVGVERTWQTIDRKLSAWLLEPTLLALDAPLGWPAALSHALQDHHAGAALPAVANSLFRRATDDVVAGALGKRPLDVGADRIARTAHTALALLDRLRAATRASVPLAWRPGRIEDTSVIEVYPAGTLMARRLPSAGYKGAGDSAVAVRRAIIDALEGEVLAAPSSVEAMLASDHVLDAVLCCLAGADFLMRSVIAPDDLALARREGWIWVRPASDD